MKRSQIKGQLSLFDLISKDVPQVEVPIEGIINLKSSPISDYKVKLCYGDLTLIVAMIRDYIKGLDRMNEDGDLTINQIQYEAYYRGKFMAIADRISEQIEYNYDEHLNKCIKKLGKEDNSDIGGEALSLALKRG